MRAYMWFVKPGTDPSKGDMPATLEVPLHNSMNKVDLTVEKVVDRTVGGNPIEQTVYHGDLQSNTQLLYHIPPVGYTFRGQFAYVDFKFRMNPEAPVTTTTR